MKNETERIVKSLEDEIVILQNEQAALIRNKWRLEEEIRKQKALVERLKTHATEETERKGAWRKVAALLLAIWTLFLSLFHIERK